MTAGRWCGVAAIVGGIVTAIAPVIFSVSAPGWLRLFNILFVATPLLLVIGVYGLTTVYSEVSGVGAWLLGAGLIGLVPILAHRTLITYTLATGSIFILVAIIGIVLFEVGAILIAMDAYLNGLSRTHSSMVLPIAAPVSMIGIIVLVSIAPVAIPLWGGVAWYVGVFGLVWVALGYQTLKPTSQNLSP